MQTHPETTLIHIATSERPMYTSKSGSTGPEIGCFETMFLKLERQSKKDGRKGDDGIAYQSVSSIATYIAPIAKMIWNQEYYTVRVE